MLRTFLAGILIALAACGTTGGAGAACSGSADCASGLDCAGPNEFRGCGIAPQHGCSTTADCTAGEVCHAIYDACSDSGVGSRCGPPCTATSCGDGFRCNASGACEPVPCDQGFTCAAPRVCDPARAAGTGPVYTESQGCVPVSCSSDADCATGEACVNGTCQTGPGTCEMPVAIP